MGISRKILDKVAVFVAEFLGTAFLIFLGCLSCVKGLGTPLHLQVAFGFGLALMLNIQIFGSTSGCHINPAVTVGALVYGLIDASTAALYFVAQNLGGIFGFGLLKLVIPSVLTDPEDSTGPGTCSTVPHKDVPPLQAAAIEFIATFIFISTLCGIWDPRHKHLHDSVPLRAGLTITALAIAIGPYTGGSMNPPRSLGPAIFNGDWDHHWVYWVPQLAAGFIAAALYKFLFWREPPKENVRQMEELTSLNDKA